MTRTHVGAILWLILAGAAGAAVSALSMETRARITETASSIVRFHGQGPVDVTTRFPGQVELEPGDGVYRREDTRFLRIGQVVAAGADGRVTLRLDPFEHAALPAAPVPLAFESDASLPWVYEALLPPPIRAKVVADWADVRAQHEARFLRELTPLLREVSANLARLLGEELQASLRRHSDELRALADDYGRSLLQDTLLPLLQEEVWPIMRAHGEAPAREVGRRLWDAAPIIGFAWSGLLDKMPLTEPTRIEERWNRYLHEDAIPILREHQPMLEAAAAEILRDVLTNERVRAETGAAIAGLLSDERVQSLLKDLATEVARSERLRDYLVQVTEDPRTRALSGWVGDELDALYRRVARMIVLEEGSDHISPHFARFLRTLVLKKDRRWILLEAADGPLAAEPRPGESTRGEALRGGDER